jgi:hypothetical protein
MKPPGACPFVDSSSTDTLQAARHPQPSIGSSLPSHIEHRQMGGLEVRMRRVKGNVLVANHAFRTLLIG